MNCFKYNIFVFKTFYKNFREYIRTKNLNYKNENIKRKYLSNVQRNKLLKVKSIPLELENYFLEIKERDLKDGEGKVKREIGELFSKPIIVFLDNMDKFEQKEMKKIRFIKNTWYDWLINYISDPVRESVGVFKDKIVRLFSTSTPK